MVGKKVEPQALWLRLFVAQSRALSCGSLQIALLYEFVIQPFVAAWHSLSVSLPCECTTGSLGLRPAHVVTLALHRFFFAFQ